MTGPPTWPRRFAKVLDPEEVIERSRWSKAVWGTTTGTRSTHPTQFLVLFPHQSGGVTEARIMMPTNDTNQMDRLPHNCAPPRPPPPVLLWSSKGMMCSVPGKGWLAKLLKL